MTLSGVDLAWQSERNPSAIAWGNLNNNILTVTKVEPAVIGIDTVCNKLIETDDLQGIAIDAPLIINNITGQRNCETEIGTEYGSRYASCHTSNSTLYPDAKSVYLSQKLQSHGFQHLTNDKWQIECYPHPAIIEIFGLPERLKYKKGNVSEKKSGQKTLAGLIKNLSDSSTLKLVFKDNANQSLDEFHIDTLKGISLKSNEDALDAIVCLYIAGLYAIHADGHTFGNVDSGYVWVPTGECL